MHIKNFSAPLGALLVVIIFSSCGFFRNFTTYFNVLYLAQRHLDLYEDQLRGESTTKDAAIAAAFTHHWMEEELVTYDIRRKQGVPVIAFPLISKPKFSVIKGTASQHLDSAVILGSKILADKHQSKYVEDALFIVGKALFYKQNYEGAKRKFYELLYKYPNTQYGDQTAMFLAEAQVETGESDSANASLDAILKRGNNGAKLTSEIHKTFAGLLVTSSYDNYDRAANELQLAEEGATTDDKAELEYDRGRLYFVMRKWDLAETAFRNASSLSSDNTFTGEALTALAETLRHRDNYAEAKTTLTEVISKTRYASSQPMAQYELAYTIDLEARNKVGGNLRSSEFITTYLPPVRIAYFALDTLYRSTSQAIMVRSRFRQAELLREIGKYDSAAGLANIIIGTKDFSSPEMNNYVNDRMRALTRYAENRQQLIRLDTIENLLRKLRRPGSTMMETVMKELRQDAIQEFLGPKWNPGENYTFTVDEEKKIEELIVKIKKQKASSGINVFSLNFSDTSKYIDSVFTAIARAHFELGRAYEQLGEPENALDEYRSATKNRYRENDTSSSQLRAQILFSWVQLDNDLNRTTERDSLIELLIKNFGDTKYAMAAASEYGGTKDKNSPGEVAFRNALASAKSSFESAKPALLAIVAKHPHEDVAPRALYTIGMNYEDINRNDSALFYYYRLSKEYPFSKYTEYLKPRISYALQEYDKRKTAVAPQKK